MDSDSTLRISSIAMVNCAISDCISNNAVLTIASMS